MTVMFTAEFFFILFFACLFVLLFSCLLNEREVWEFPLLAFMSEDSGLPVPRSQWVERGVSCATCGKKFSLFTANSNCPCCGKLCCSDCVQAECAIVGGSAPSKVCIDCFSMLQSRRRVEPDEGSLLREFNAASAISFQTRLAADGQVESEKTSRVSPPNGGGVQHVSRANGSSNSFPGLREYVDDLLKKSELLRMENDVLLNRLREQEVEIHALRLERDRAVARTALEGEFMADRSGTSQASDEILKELREELAIAHLRIESVEGELTKALDREKSSETMVKNLKQRLCNYKEEVVRLLKSQEEVERAPRVIGDRNILSIRRLPPSIVQDTILAVVPPKSCAAIGTGIDLRDWGFDAFEVASRVPSVLQSVAMHVALAWDFFTSQEESQKWAFLVAAVENNYRPNPYHNAIHAADVLQGTFSLVSAVKPLMDHMTPLERKAVAFAALAHDVCHPGRTNAFLAAVQDPVSFKFCGKGTLEQLHTAKAFELLNVTEFDFTSSMDNASFLEFKNIVSHLIGHTDMSLHSENIAKQGAKLSAGGFDYTRKEDRLEALSLLLHAADIGASSRGVAIARKWLVILQEFADQAEDERRRGLPVTPGFDTPSSVEKSQIPFLDFFVIPTFDLLHQLFPSIEEPLHNLRKLREFYAAKAGVTTPFPPPVDYRSREEKMRSLEAELAYFRRREEEFHRQLQEMGTASDNVNENSAALNTSEGALNMQSQLVWRAEGNKNAGGGFQNEKDVRESQDLSMDRLVSSKTVEPATGDKRLPERRGSRVETKESYERKLSEREAALMASTRLMENREKKLAIFSEKLAEIAEGLQEERKRFQPMEDFKTSSFSRETELLSEKNTSMDITRRLSTQWEAEERLARKYSELDELLLIVRAMRMGYAARYNTDIHWKALSATLAEREAAIAEAVELSRQRRRHVEEGRGLQPTATQLDRLENVIFQLMSAITLLTQC
ncbi:cAMP phosphodiesterase A, putative [Trypanosoma cruzi marinkellei]|uniref:Phosphodiesterase n=1 Tax=Trypanosoma cruzi marinkellei TaxID=85056 RepID=K2NVC9_TRYCR|nr:cAMP phosphodiesterase A, putative [Trypanosoma cruzi marinkellei]